LLHDADISLSCHQHDKTNLKGLETRSRQSAVLFTQATAAITPHLEPDACAHRRHE